MATAYSSGFYRNAIYVFIKDVKSLISTMKEMGNPFWDTSGDLLVLDTRVVAEVAVVDSVRKMKTNARSSSRNVWWTAQTQSTKQSQRTRPQDDQTERKRDGDKETS